MMNSRNERFEFIVLLIVLPFVASGAAPSLADEKLRGDERLAGILRGDPPSSVEDLKAMQSLLRELSERVLPTTVAVRVGPAEGSGVLVSSDGYVLTAAHVIGKPGRPALVFLQDGRRFSAQTLGTFRTLDAGLLKIQLPPDNGEQFVHAELGDSSQLALGHWCLAAGHPGGIRPAQQPTLRLGRLLTINPDSALTTDCTLIGGDSGGPLFDLQGRVIGIHSRIGANLSANLHVPVNSFRDSWERLARGENWGYLPGRRPFLGVQGEAAAADARISRVFPESPAEKAGVRQGDIVIRFAEQPVMNFDSLQRLVEAEEPGAKVKLTVLRGGKQTVLDLVIGRRLGE